MIVKYGATIGDLRPVELILRNNVAATVKHEAPHMNNQEPEALDAWTGMPADFEDVEIEPIVLPATARKKNALNFDVGGWLWKHMASGSAATPSQVLALLATDENVRVRRRCALNPSTNADALALLADDQDESVRAAVARNMHTPIYILRKLAQDESVEVRFAIAANPEMPDAILLSLFLDPDPFVAERASQTLAA